MEPQESLKGQGVSITVATEGPIEDKYQPFVVCFCDIPVADLEIHMQKYGRFGLSFLKPFLVEKGANPVLYLANNSQAPNFAGDPYLENQQNSTISRRDMFHYRINDFDNLAQELNDTLVGPAHGDAWQRLFLSTAFLQSHLFSFIKYFDDATSDEDPANVYMEREWRVLGDVLFDIKDVYRVFLPSTYAERFRHDLPEYTGQVTFVDH